jgi:hypothetical protein
MRPVSVSASRPGREIEQPRGDLHGRWRQATRAVMVLLPAHGLPPAQIAELLDCHPATVRRWIGRFSAEGAAGLPGRPRSGRPQLVAIWRRPRLTARGDPAHDHVVAGIVARLLRRGTVFGALEMTSGAWVCQLGKRCAADFIALPAQVLRAFPRAPLIVVIRDDDSIHHARVVTAYLEKHPPAGAAVRGPVQPA